jgi:hypothetical protein
VRIDARDVAAAADAVLTELARFVEVPDGDGAIAAHGRLVRDVRPGGTRRAPPSSPNARDSNPEPAGRETGVYW